MSTVSVVIPCYNYARFLRRCVNSALTQQGVEVDVQIIDDASTDETPRIGRELSAEHENVVYIRHEKNWGHIATYNQGLAACTGRYSVLLSADDLLAPGALDRACRTLDANPNASFAYGRSIRFTESPPDPVLASDAGRVLLHPGQRWIRERCAVADNPIANPEVVVRTAVQHEIGDYRMDLPHTADLEVWLRCAALGDVLELPNAAQAYYRIHGDNMHTTSFAALYKRLQQRRDAFAAFFETCGRNLQDEEELRMVAGRRLAAEALWLLTRRSWRRADRSVPAAELWQFAVECGEGLRPVSGEHVAHRLRIVAPAAWDGLRSWPRSWLRARWRAHRSGLIRMVTRRVS
jgi:glycosyltransferase involved in cell wall biosynthesis